MKALMMMVIAAFGFALSAQAQSDTIPMQNRDQEMKTAQRKESQMWKELNLTQVQKTQMQAIRKDFMNQRDSTRDDNTLSTDQKNKKLAELKKDEDARINNLLTPDQQAKMKAWKEKNTAPPMSEMKINRPVIKDTM